MKNTALFLLVLNLMSVLPAKANQFSIKDFNQIAKVGILSTSLEAKVNSNLYNIY